MESSDIYMELLRVALIVILLFIIALNALRIYFKLRKTNKEIDMLEGGEFEYYCADLLESMGFTEVEVTKSSGDYGIDILAQKEGISYAIQCKRYASPVGVHAVQEAYAGRDYYDQMVGVVLTNQYFTEPAVKMAKKLKILLWDRGYLESMIEEAKYER